MGFSCLAGSVVQLSVLRQTGPTEIVKLKRVKTETLTDARKLTELFLHVMERAKKDRDGELVQTVEEAQEFWEKMMMEQFEHDETCIENMHEMQRECVAWLEELRLILRADAPSSSASVR
jgi:hypothetical protein